MVVAVASTLAVMEEQVAPEAVAVVVVNPAILVVLVALVDYLMGQMVSQHRPVILEITKVDMEQITPEVVEVAEAPWEMLTPMQEVVMVVLVSSSSHIPHKSVL